MLTAATILTFSGCVSYKPAPVSLQQSARQYAARRLDDAQLREGVARLLPRDDATWPPAQWNRAQLLAVALMDNSQLAVARTQIGSVRAREVTAGQMLNPNTTLQSEYGAHGEPHPWLYGVAFDWEVRSPSRRSLERNVAQLDTRNAELQVLDGIWAVRRDLNAALSEQQYLMRRAALLDELAGAQDHALELQRRRIQVGEDSPQELAVVEYARIDTEQQRGAAHVAASAAQADLAKALGLPVAALEGLVLQWADWGNPPDVKSDDEGRLDEEALLSRSDLEQSIGEYAISEARFKLAVKRQYPQLTIGPGYYWDHGVNKFPLDIGFTVPLNGNKGEIAEARAARELAGAQMLALQADILGQIAAAKKAEALARNEVDVAERRLTNVQRHADQRDASVKAGETDLFEQQEMKILTIRSQLEALEMHSLWQAARNRLEDALHRPLSGPEVDLARTLDATVSGERT